MHNKLRNIGLIALGAVAGVLVSLNFQAIADLKRGPLPIEELRAFTEVFGAIKTNYVEPVEDKKLITEAINGMLTGLDPHSAYLDAEAFRELQVGTQGQFGGLGIEVGMEDGFVKVISPIEDTPAFRAGIKPGDLIIKLDDTPVKGMSLNDAVKKMRGKPNTNITLTISRKGEGAPVVVTLTRAVIRVQSVKSKLLEPGYAWVRVSQFQEQTPENMVKHIDNLFKQGQVKGLVLDLRNDPGGLLHGAVAVSSAFLPVKSLIVSTDGRAEDAKRKFFANPEDYARGGRGEDVLKAVPAAVKTVPMVVLVNGGSASASEIVAGALQDHKRAIVIGTQTFGKGSVQTIMPHPGAGRDARHHRRGPERRRHPDSRGRPAAPSRERRRVGQARRAVGAARQARRAPGPGRAEADRARLEGRLPARAGARLPERRAREGPAADARQHQAGRRQLQAELVLN